MLNFVASLIAAMPVPIIFLVTGIDTSRETWGGFFQALL